MRYKNRPPQHGLVQWLNNIIINRDVLNKLNLKFEISKDRDTNPKNVTTQQKNQFCIPYIFYNDL